MIFGWGGGTLKGGPEVSPPENLFNPRLSYVSFGISGEINGTLVCKFPGQKTVQ